MAINKLADIYSIDDFKTWDIAGETIVALFIIAFLIILSFIIFILAKRADPLKRPKGLLLVAEMAVEKIDAFVAETMGQGFENFGGILLGIVPFLFLSFTIGITGLPTSMSSLNVPFTLALVTFLMIHLTSMRFTKFRYFKRFIEPLPFFLPINLISMWAPLLSLCLRMFGNAVVGWVMLSLLNYVLELASAAVFSFLPTGVNSIFFVPIATPLLHAYFDLFSGLIQTLVFTFLTACFIAQEKPEEEKVQEKLALS